MRGRGAACESEPATHASIGGHAALAGAGGLRAATGTGAVFVAPGDLELDTHTLVQPDVYVLPLVNGRRPRTQSEIGQPLLFVEVLSPSTARFDRVVKRHRYQRQGVEYWIVDLDARLVECWQPDSDRPSVHTETVTWQPAGATSALTVDFTPVFVEALGEV